MVAERCRGTTDQGKPCGARPRHRSAWCPWHDPDPEQRARHRELSRRGGASRSNAARARKALPAAAMTPVELQNFMIVTMRGTLAGRVDKGVANAVANLGRTIASLYGPATWEDRLAELERGEGRSA